MFYLPPHLDLLSSLCKELPKDFFSQSIVIGCQHILPSTHLMIKKMIEYGLPKENIALIGKCYSTSTYSLRKMLEEGIYIASETTEYNSHQPFDEKFQKDMRFFLKNQMTKKKIQPDQSIILFDDGGELIQVMQDYFPEYNKVLAIEQTSAGYNKLKHKKFNFPIVNIARSYAKLEIEPPFVALSQLKKITQYISSMDIHKKRFLVVGKGSIGNAIYHELHKKYNVETYDIKPELSTIDHLHNSLKDFDVIIGTTGEKTLEYSQYKFLKKGTILISASSSDREFDANAFRKNLPVNTDCHKNLSFEDIHLINSGFPINFAGKIFDTIPLHCIQVTCALLLAGTFNINKEDFSEKGFINLDHSIQQKILNDFFNIQDNFNRPSSVFSLKYEKTSALM